MKYFDDIEEFPLWNWRKCTQGEENYTRIRKQLGTKKRDSVAWENLQDQHIEKFGLADDHEKILELKMQMAEMQLDYCIDKNAFLLNAIRVIEEDIKEILDRSMEGASIDDCLMALSKWMGFRLDQKVISVVEFQTYLKAYQTEAKENKRKTA